uniref:Uncharacterized protein n=1 Tax=Rhizophora mucronata TaxID=61149 RepID=A0A2P2QDF2_RHIMU
MVLRMHVQRTIIVRWSCCSLYTPFNTLILPLIYQNLLLCHQENIPTSLA